ncbi:MAG: Gfo/Idh/MocA family oxidoreductase [Myxococcota bacterium]
MSPTRRRYAQVGLGVRSWLYSIGLTDWHAAQGELVGLCDSNAGRLEHRDRFVRSKGLAPVACDAGDYLRMLRESRADCVIVTSPDRCHADHVCQALEVGCDVITEKPMTIDAASCQRILDAQRKSGRRVSVTFNYRYAPPRVQVKQLLQAGVIGDVLSVDFHWLLDTTHGADYFRRWHRRRENSGGLLVHKATHHFDLVNWWLDSVPRRVFASGARAYYTPAQATRLGLDGRGPRCLDCPEAGRCPFHLDLRGRKELAAIYLKHEHHDGYHRDGCVFSPEIDIEDSAVVAVDYGPPREVALDDASGGHGGGDLPLVRDLLDPDPAPDPCGRAADHRAGAWSILTGIAANRSIATGQPVKVSSLVRGLDLP